MDTAQLLARPHDMSVGDAAPYREGFATEMASVGYTTLTVCGYLDSAIHFGGWLETQGLSLAGINEKTVKAFGAGLPVLITPPSACSLGRIEQAHDQTSVEKATEVDRRQGQAREF